jgi:hypothetical protein
MAEHLADGNLLGSASIRRFSASRRLTRDCWRPANNPSHGEASPWPDLSICDDRWIVLTITAFIAVLDNKFYRARTRVVAADNADTSSQELVYPRTIMCNVAVTLFTFLGR